MASSKVSAGSIEAGKDGSFEGFPVDIALFDPKGLRRCGVSGWLGRLYGGWGHSGGGGTRR